MAMVFEATDVASVPSRLYNEIAMKWVKDSSKSVLEPAIEAHVAQQQSRKAGRVVHGSSSHG